MNARDGEFVLHDRAEHFDVCREFYWFCDLVGLMHDLPPEGETCVDSLFKVQKILDRQGIHF